MESLTEKNACVFRGVAGGAGETAEAARLRGMSRPMLAWYDLNRRALPWRENTDPYRVWVSEIMLQQTQVDTVVPYYNRFMRALPDIGSLAEAGEEQLMKLWEGLGYYSRARNLQKAARAIVEKHGGRFPEIYADILALPGIGKYTAGAIVSIAFGKPVPAVDGNVLRVVARLTGSGADIAAPAVKDAFAALLGRIYPDSRSGDFTQSLMELGATVCLPKGEPKCALCPVAGLCRAHESGTQTALPVKSGKRPRKKERKTVFLLRCGEKVAVRRRGENVLLAGLWEFPNAEGNLSPREAEEVLARWGIAAAELKAGMRRKHVFTHVEWEMTSYIADCGNMAPGFLWVTRETLAGELTLPSAFRPFLDAVSETA